MSFGYDRQPTVMIGDTATLTSYVYTEDDLLVPQSDITGVAFTVLAPTDTPESPSIDGEPGDITGDGTGTYTVPGSVTGAPGQYKAVATFTYTENATTKIASRLCSFEVDDPFEYTGLAPSDDAVRLCWTYLEDCFDSEQGGPWLRDMTMAVFDQTKLRALIPQVLLDINNQMPFTTYSADSFPYGGDGEALFAQGLLVASIRHLMRAYTEQPDIVSSPVAFMDRKRYQQAWKAQYDVELPAWQHNLNRWKLQQYDLSSSAMLIGNKAGRYLGGPLRSRNMGRFGGY